MNGIKLNLNNGNAFMDWHLSNQDLQHLTKVEDINVDLASRWFCNSSHSLPWVWWIYLLHDIGSRNLRSQGCQLFPPSFIASDETEIEPFTRKKQHSSHSQSTLAHKPMWVYDTDMLTANFSLSSFNFNKTEAVVTN